MSPVTCFHRILSHDVCKPVMEAYEAVCAQVAQAHYESREKHYPT